MALKLRTKINFPATVIATGGLKVDKLNGVWTIEPDFSQLAALTGVAVTDPSLKQVWIYDPVLLQYNVLTLSGLGDALYRLTSTTSNSIGTGSKTFTVQANKDIGAGSWLLIVSDAAASTNYMYGQVTAYSTTTLTVTVTGIGGSGTHTDWTMRVASPPGPTGAKGDTGPTAISGTPTTGQMTKFFDASTIQAATAGTDYMGMATASQSFTGGVVLTEFDNGTKSSGSYTPEPGNGPFQKVTNNGAHTLTASANMGQCKLRVINGASAGAITFSGFDKQLTGDVYATTNANQYDVYITISGKKTYQIVALQ